MVSKGDRGPPWGVPITLALKGIPDPYTQVYIGRCHDLITGVHGEYPILLYGELCEVIQDLDFGIFRPLRASRQADRASAPGAGVKW